MKTNLKKAKLQTTKASYKNISATIVSDSNYYTVHDTAKNEYLGLINAEFKFIGSTALTTNQLKNIISVIEMIKH